MEESGPSTSNNAETPASTVSESTSDMIDNATFFKNLRFPAYEPKVKKVLYLCAEEDEKWAKKVGWKNIFPEELQDHSYCNPGQTEKYKPRPDELPEPETKDMEPIYAEDEVRKPNEHFLEEEHISPRVAGHRLLAMNGEVMESGSVTPHNQRPVPSQVRSRVPILPQPPHRMTPVGLDPRVPIQTGRAPLIVPARGRTLSRSQDVVLPDNHMTLQRNSMSPMKTNISEIGVPLHPDGVTRTISPQKVRIIRQNPERSSHLAVRQPAIIPQNVTRARALEREEVLPPDIAATALDLLSEHLAVAAAVDPTDQYKDMNAETMKMEIDSIRRKLQTDTLGNVEGVRQPRLQSPPMRRLTSPPQGGRHRTTSTSSNSSIPGTVRTGALIRHPGSPPLRVPMDGVRVQPAIGTPSMRHGVKSNLKKTVVPQQPVDAVEPSRRSSRARNSTTKKEEQEEKMRCLCGVTTDTPKGEPWVSCDRCGVWQHQFCAGFKSRKGANYLCDECEDPVNRRKRPSEQESIAYINARIKKFGPGDKASDDEEEDDVDKPLRGADRKHQTRRETAATTPVRGTVTKNVRSLLTVAGTGNNFTGPKMLVSCAKMNVANDHTPGIVAQCSIAPGTAVIEIVANLCIPADIDKPKSYNPHIFYYDGLVDQKAALTTAQKQENQICLDARKFALDGKFVRRCCRPNSTIKHIYASNQVNFYVVTRQQINIQDEITVPFEAGFKPTRRDQCRCIPDSGCLLDTGSFIGPGFCDLSPVRSLPLKSPPKSPISQTAASPTRRFVSPPRQPIQQEVAVEEVKAREEKSEEETPAPRSARRGRIQSTSKKASETEEVKTEEIKEERNEEMKETPQEDPVAKKKSPVKQETPKRTAPKKKPSFPKSELDELLELQNNVHFDVDFKQKESREQRKAREMFERMEKESARKAALEQAKDKTKVSATTSKAAQKTPKATPKAVKKEMVQEETPSRRTRSQTDDMPTTSKVEVKEVAAEPISEQVEKSPSPSKSMSAPKKMFQHRYNQEKAAEPKEPVSKRSRRSEAKVEAHTFDISKEHAASLKILEKKLKNEDYTLPADCLKYVPKKSEPTVKKAKAVSKRKTPKETVSIEPEVVPKKGKAVEVKEEKTVPERSRKKSESKTKVVEKKKEEPKTEVKTEEDNEKESEPLIEEPVPEPAPITERPRRSINLEEYKKRRAERPVDEEPTELKRKSFMPDFNNVPQTVTLPDLPLGYIDQKQLEREILGLPSTRTPSSSTRQSMRSSSSAAQPSTTSSMTSPAERKERGLLRDRLAQLFSQDPLLNPQSSSSSPSDPRVRRSRFTE